MATTDGNGIVFYETTDPVSPLQTLLNTGQQSVSNAIGTRQRKTNVTGGARPVSPAPVAGDTVFETDTFNTFVYDGTNWRPQGTGIYSASYLNANQTVNTVTATTILGTAFVQDARGITYTSGTGLFTIPVTGMYQINGGVVYDSNVAGAYRLAWVETSASVRITDWSTYGSFAASKTVGGARLCRITAGTQIRLVTYHAAGGALNAVGGTIAGATFLDIQYIGG